MDLQGFKCKQKKTTKWNATGALKNDNYLSIHVENFLKSFYPSYTVKSKCKKPLCLSSVRAVKLPIHLLGFFKQIIRPKVLR